MTANPNPNPPTPDLADLIKPKTTVVPGTPPNPPAFNNAPQNPSINIVAPNAVPAAPVPPLGVGTPKPEQLVPAPGVKSSTGGPGTELAPKIGQVELVPPETVHTVGNISDDADADSVSVALPDNPVKVYKLADVKDRYGAIEQYKLDCGIRSTIHNFVVSYVGSQE
jgi:hypothetical protein